jgi:hypothetical protein
MCRNEKSLDQKIAILRKLAEAVRYDLPSVALVRAKIVSLEADSVTTGFEEMRKTG